MGSFRCVIYAFVLISLLESYCGLWMFLCLINSLQFMKVLLVYVEYPRVKDKHSCFALGLGLATYASVQGFRLFEKYYNFELGNCMSFFIACSLPLLRLVSFVTKKIIKYREITFIKHSRLYPKLNQSIVENFIPN